MNRSIVPAFLFVVLFSRPAMAYIGPGAGLAAIAIFFAVIAAVGVAFIGFLWYPLRRLLRRARGTSGDTDSP
jgi:cobalamin synthase